MTTGNGKGHHGLPPSDAEKRELLLRLLQERRGIAGPQPIAIIGLSGRYPQADTLDAFWTHLKAGRSCISEVPPERWRWERYHHPDSEQPDSIYSRWGGFLADFDKFDPAFFNISPREAEVMDPQERLFLEVAWATFEDAGYDVTAPSLDRDIGVFVGAMNGGYGWVAGEAWASGLWSSGRAAYWSIANRVSYLLNLSGPSFALDSACSSSLTALHLACESLRRGECRAALVGGVNLILHPLHYYGLVSMRMLSHGDQCRAFGDGADGFVDGEGVGAVLLKPLAQALADKDRIWAVIRGTAVNAGGKTSGYTVPNPHAQEQVIARALKEAGVHPRTISYVEAHGTGTSLGDPIEIAGLQRAWRAHTQDRQFCALGSVKSNIGHLESAAGIAALTKVALQLRDGLLVPSLHSEVTNPHIDFAASPFFVQHALSEWRRPDDGKTPRRAGISSFGAGGANAHVILEEAPAQPGPALPEEEGVPLVLVLSAKNQERLRAYAGVMADFLERNERARERGEFSVRLADIAYTSQVGRQAMEERLAVVASRVGVFIDALRAFASQQATSGVLFHGRASPSAEQPAPLPAESTAEAMARGWVAGAPVSWSRLHEGRPRQRVSIPTYPFSRKRYWIGEQRARMARRDAPASPPARVEPAPPPPTESPANEVPVVQRPKIQLKRPGQVSPRESTPSETSHVEPRQEPAPRVESPAEPAKVMAPEAPRQETEPASARRVDARAVQAKLKQIVKEGLAAVLYTEASDIDEVKPFLELGVDSILVVEFVKGLNQTLGTRLKVNKLYDFPSVNLLTDHLLTLVDGAALLGGGEPLSVEVAPSPVSAAPAAAMPPVSPTVVMPPASPSGGMHQLPPAVAMPPAPPTVAMPVAAPTVGLPAVPAAAVMPPTSPSVAMPAVPATVTMAQGSPAAAMPSAAPIVATPSVQTTVAIPPASPTVAAHSVQTTVAIPPASPTVAAHSAPTPVAAPPAPMQVSPAATSLPEPVPTVSAPRERKPIAEPVRETAVAIIGMAGRFPGAQNLDEYWSNLARGVDSVTEVPPERWSVAKHFDPDPKKKGTSYSKWGGFLTDIDKFDPLFFSVSPAEARLMDPQQRLFLEQAWKAFEDAGYSPEQLDQARCGVFVGLMSNDYARMILAAEPDRSPSLQMMGNSSSILAARIAYLLNLKGPALCLDTACSSSLVATHLAVQSLLAGETDLMLAGGVTLYLDEESYIQMSKAGMLSPEGRCKTFDDRADGFVPGEGVGAVVLKRLSDALRDGDHVYGIIRGSGLNQDGKTNGISAPSSEAQMRLELEVYQRSGISPDSLTYVEAHGTGTRLGDPIEIEALSEAFARYTDRKQFCAIGSVKSNLGHTSAAAGMAGLMKVLLSFRHRQLPPSLHFHRQNSHIDFGSTPFFVNTALRDWVVPGHGPRRAAISGFSFSGTNAHLVLEEPPVREPSRREAPGTWHVFPFSAKTEDSLAWRLRDMAAWLRKQGEGIPLGDIAYVLATGRAHHRFRVAFVVRDRHELLDALDAALAGRDAPGLLVAEPGTSTQKVDPFLQDLGERLLGELGSRAGLPEETAREKLRSLASLYVRGCQLGWARLFPGRHLRVPLPTYPFARDRYWIADGARGAEKALPEGLDVEATHALLGGAYRTLLDTSSPMLADHRVEGASVLPGMACLELARAAHARLHGEGPVTLSQVAWLQPWMLGAGEKERAVWAVVSPRADHTAFEIRGGPRTDAVVHCKGRIGPVERGSTSDNPRLAVEPIRARCTERVGAAELYRRFEGMRLSYGPSFRTVREVWSNGEEALGRLELPDAATGDGRGWSLLPNLLDGAAQTIAVLAGQEGGTVLPFAVGAVELHRPLPRAGYAYVRTLERSRYDVTLVDDQGDVCLVLRELRFRGNKAPDPTPRRTDVQDAEPGFFYVPQWTPAPLASGAVSDVSSMSAVILSTADNLGLEESLAAAHGQARVVRVRLGLRTRQEAPGRWEWASDDVEGLKAWWDEAGGPRRVYFLGGIETREPSIEDLGALDASQERGVVSLFRLLKGLSRLGGLRQALDLKVVTVDAHAVLDEERGRPYGASLHGFCKSLAKEYPMLAVSCLDVGSRDVLQAPGRVVAHLLAEPAQKASEDVAVRDGGRLVRRLLPARLETGELPLRQNGVYLIVGGTGGIGLQLAEDLAGRYRARLVLLGRSALTDAQRRRIADIEARGGTVLHVQADVSDESSMRAAIARVKSRFGEIHGAVHSALVLRDAPLERMDEAALREALASKVRGSVVLHTVLRDEPLDFLLFFSSVQSFTGNAGQSNYAAASTFQDALAGFLSRTSRARVKVINWGYWGSVGAVVDAKYQRAMALRGVHSIEIPEGMDAIRRVLASGASQVIAFKAERDILTKLGVDWSQQAVVRAARHVPAPGAARPTPVAAPQVSAGPSLAEVERRIVEHTSAALGVNAKSLDPEVPFSDYGVDSITGAALIERISEDFDLDLPVTVVFDYSSVRELARHLLSQLGARKVTEPEPFEAREPEPALPVIEVRAAEQREPPRPEPVREPVASPEPVTRRAPVSGGIAIIGMSGRFPGAPDLDTFWKRLAGGDDLIEEIPRERWDIDAVYDPTPHKDPDKTYGRWGGFLGDIDKFDAAFFNIAGREADLMDPQQRLFLEESWKALEDAGYATKSVSNRRCGVFVGVETGDYALGMARAGVRREAQAIWGNDTSILAARISYFLNLKGPAVALNTACSSSLVAIHLACQSLLTGESEMAIAGGVYVATTPDFHIHASNALMLSPDGRCRSFAQGANGFVPGEGVGAVVLKPLEAALRDGDPIHGVIRATGTNQDGRTNGITAPSAAAQTELEVSVYEAAGCDPDTITYVEAHGSGTKLGDPIEVRALTNAFRRWTNRKAYCALGSVKTNIGHTISAAGIAGVLKVLLSLKHGAIPPSLHFDVPNEHIDFANSPFFVNTRLREWVPTPGAPKRAAVSSFGFSGTNAHVLLEEAPARRAPPRASSEAAPQFLPLSAKTPESLQLAALQLTDFLRRLTPGGSVDRDEAGSLSQTVVAVAADLLQVSARAIDPERPFEECGLDAQQLAVLAEELSRKLGTDVRPRMLIDFPTPGALARHLAKPVPRVRVADGAEAPTLADVAYTLQTGREAMGERLAIVATRVDEAIEALTRFAAGQELPSVLYRGRVGADSAVMGLLSQGRAGEAFLRVAMEEKQLSTLAQLWVMGLDVPWRTLHGDVTPRRVSLPTYPFARVRHWFTDEAPAPREVPSLLDSGVEQSLSALAQRQRPAPVRQDEYERFGQLLLLDTFQRLGVFLRGGERYSLESLRARLRIADAHARLYVALLDVLARAGFVRVEGNEVTGLAALDGAPLRTELRGLEALGERLSREIPMAAPYIRVLRVCAARYGEVLRGEIPATDVLFPQSSMELMGALYKGNAIADYYNQLVADSVRRYIEERSPSLPTGGKIRILEVGAGTGGTSELVLRAIRGYGERLVYTYTDVSRSFVEYGRKHFDADFMAFSVLNIEKDITTQGFEPGSFDLVIAANVLHATPSLRATLGQVKALLKPGGWLVLNEVTTPQDFATMVLGLLPGWWCFQDPELRLKDSPLLTPPMWTALLGELGFPKVVTLGAPDGSRRELGQSILIAERDRSARVVSEARSRPSAPAPVSRPVPTAGRDRPAPVTSGKSLEAVIAQSIEAVLRNGVVDLDPHAPFQDFGIDSIYAVSIVERLNEVLGIQLRTTDLFNFASIAKLAEHIRTHAPSARVERATSDIGPESVAAPSPGSPPSAAVPGDGNGRTQASVSASSPPSSAPVDGKPHDGGDGLLLMLERIEAGELDVSAVQRFVGGAS
uniref:Polyketide synthase n=1 Tax=Pyxidicoccus sp. MCy9557 TaxID=2012863 RepID=A0A1Z2TJL7_9BACT|nr:polyketide synthase [Pyxidicoccus sp. MCy9557]